MVAGARFACVLRFDMKKIQARLIRYLCILAPLAAANPQADRSLASRASSERPRIVLKATLDDETISPGTAKYLRRVIAEANERRAECVVIVLDTPGGLLASTRKLTKQILASRTPVVVYVAPSGSRAASAGLFVTLASHVAAMAPGTTIGAAHPVQLGGFPLDPRPNESPGRKGGASEEEEEEEEEEEKEAKKTERTASRSPRSPSEQKIINDTVAWVRALARLRDRNVEWAVDAVEHSVSITAADAVERNVVELLAQDVDDLLEQLDGREVSTPAGPFVLHTAGAEVESMPPWWGERVLSLISHPNVAFLLMIWWATQGVEEREVYFHLLGVVEGVAVTIYGYYYGASQKD